MRRLLKIRIATVGLLALLLLPATSEAQVSGWNTLLTRLPYLTDVTQQSVGVTWADLNKNARGIVTYGALPGCTGSTASDAKLGPPVTVGSTKEYTHTVIVTGLAAGSTYCYRIHDSTPTTDLLGTMASPSFQTLPSSGSFTFLVLGDWGDTSSGFNSGQASLDSVIAQTAQADGALFAANTGDVAYPSGSQTNFGDLYQTGTNISAVFGPSYWAGVGLSLPTMATTANHGRSATFFGVWPETATVAASGGSYSMINYPSIDGTNPASGTAGWYAWSVGGTRFYSLSADWADQNVGTADGSLCGVQFAGSVCKTYQVDADQHWQTSSPEYQWLAGDLAAHPGGVKFAFFHYPLRSDVPQQTDDVYLNVSPLNPHAPNSLESLLSQNGVGVVFNGHAHIYQRNVPPPGGVVSYVTGGGGGVLEPIAKSSTKNCSTTDAYGLGWSPSSSKGSLCDAANPSAPKPTAANQVYHFLKVQVSGTTVTVTPMNANGQAFDPMTYDFSPDSAAPTMGTVAPLTFTKAKGSTPAKVTLNWGAGSDNVGVIAYDIYRQASGSQPMYMATVDPAVRSYANSPPAGTYTYTVVARDQAGNQSAPSSAGSVTVP